MSPAEPKPPSSPASKGWYDTLVSGVATLDGLPTGFDLGPDLLKVRHPAASSPVVRVADIISADRSFAADVTHFRHDDPRIE